MGSVTWRGNGGNWSTPVDWTGNAVPGPVDDVTIPGAGNVVLDGSEAAHSLTLAGGTLALIGSLALGGAISLAPGALLELGGTLTGGTLTESAGSTLQGLGGTLDGVLLGAGVAPLGGVTITAATAPLNLGGSIAVDGTLTLKAGIYDGFGFALAADTAELDVAAGAAATLGPGGGVTLIDSNATSLSPGTTLTLGGAGTLENDGLIASRFADGKVAALDVTAAGFVNGGELMLDASTSTASGVFTITPSTKGPGQTGTLTWEQAIAPTLAITSPLFVNTGTVLASGGTVDIDGAVFDNEGGITLVDAPSQAVTVGPNAVASVIAAPLPTLLRFGAGVTGFGNNGTIVADTVEFDGSVALGALGLVQGALLFAGTLDLGGGTLDASAYGGVTITGTVTDGTLMAGSGTLALDGATLQNVSVAPGGNVVAQAPVTLLDPPPGVSAITLDGTTTELGFTGNGTSLDFVSVVAGSTAAVDRILDLGFGAVTLGPHFALTADVAGSAVAIVGAQSFQLQGAVDAEGSQLVFATTLDGDGTITLGDTASVTLSALAATASLTVAFGAGPALLVVPGSGAGLTFTGLHVGDVIDFKAVSSLPGGPFAQPGAAISGDALDVTGASGDTASVPVMFADPALTFATGQDGAGGTLVTAACFRAGTRIATPYGEVAVELLRIGDAVLTVGGEAARIRWIGRRSYMAAMVAANPQLRPVRIARGALGDGMPRRALELSAEHAVCVGGVLVPAGALVNGASITRAEAGGNVAYLHIELDAHALILAEGAPAESFVALIPRTIFDNAAEYAALYPGDAPVAPPPSLRRETSGAAVARAWAVCAARAGVAARASSGALRGHAERIRSGILEGWACDDAGPARFELIADGRVLGRVEANGYRPDLDFHGLPACAFQVRVPPRAELALRRVGDGAALPFAPEALAA